MPVCRCGHISTRHYLHSSAFGDEDIPRVATVTFVVLYGNALAHVWVRWSGNMSCSCRSLEQAAARAGLYRWASAEETILQEWWNKRKRKERNKCIDRCFLCFLWLVRYKKSNFFSSGMFLSLEAFAYLENCLLILNLRRHVEVLQNVLKAGLCGLETAVSKTSNWNLVKYDECLISARKVWTALFDLKIIKILSITAQEWKKINTCHESCIYIWLQRTLKSTLLSYPYK